MVKNPPKTAKDFLSISGIGEARVKQYGEAFINLFSVNETSIFSQSYPQKTFKPPGRQFLSGS
jgi:hypothetical protein